MSDLKKQTGLWIDEVVLFSNLTPLEKLILADIVVLSSKGNRFFKTNQVIADTFNVSLRTVNYAIRKLITKEIIISIVTTPYGNNKKKRVIVLGKNYISKLKKL